MTYGLTVGKFAPLHKGHQYLIESALKEVDALIVIVYEAPQIPELTLGMRVEWLKRLYPDLIVILGDQVPKDVGWTEAIQQKHIDYILSLVTAYEIKAFYSSEAYGEKMSKALGCDHRLIDGDRLTVPISASLIRSDLEAYKTYLDPIIYEDLKTIYESVSR